MPALKFVYAVALTARDPVNILGHEIYHRFDLDGRIHDDERWLPDD